MRLSEKMRLFGRILAVFLLTSAIELVLLIQIGRVIGFWPTVAIIIVSGVLGSFLVRREGLRVWRRFNEKLSQGSVPGHELMDGIIVLISGVLLLTPGVITDFVGLLGLIPPTRAMFRRQLARRLEGTVRSGTPWIRFGAFGSRASGGDTAQGPHEAEWGGTPKERPQHTGAPKRNPQEG